MYIYSCKLIKFLIVINLIFSFKVNSQTPFFTSNVNLSENELSNFYSSFSIDNSQVYFNSNDYYLHVFDKKTGNLNWSYNISKKSNETPKLNNTSVFVNKHFSEFENKCLQLNTITGEIIQTLSIESINSRPFYKDSIMYCTAIDKELGGTLLAYDLKNNKTLWKQFIAHGVDKHPYYLSNKIIANVEEDNWFEIDYKGSLKDTICKKQNNLFVENIKCVNNFIYLSHDGKEISKKFLKEHLGTYEDLKMTTNKHFTFILQYNKLLILKDKLKVHKELEVDQIVRVPDDAINEYREILKVDENYIWFFYENRVVVYDYIKNETKKIIDLSEWMAHQIVLDDNQIWLISKKDGQLVGLKIE
jgi:hypothetical protein